MRALEGERACDGLTQYLYGNVRARHYSTLLGRWLSQDPLFYGHRYYHPWLGRFGSRDPIGYRGSRWNFYAYVGSSPIVHKDPSGLAVKNVICPNGGSISIDFECCPPARQANLETAMCDAKRKASDAARRLADLISDIGSKDYVLDTQAAECARKWFGGGNIIHVASVFAEIGHGLGRTTLKIDCDGGPGCDGTIKAYVPRKWWNGLGQTSPRSTTEGARIVICPDMFPKVAQMQADILLHELTHWWGGTEDYGTIDPTSESSDQPTYWEPRGGLREEPENIELGAEELVDNADTYVGFANCLSK